MMTIQELTDRMNEFVTRMGWYQEDSPFPQTPRNIAISMALEAAEVLEHFQWGEEAETTALAGEWADGALHLLQLAYLTGTDLEQAILDKLAYNYLDIVRFPSKAVKTACDGRRNRPAAVSEQSAQADFAPDSLRIYSPGPNLTMSSDTRKWEWGG